MKEILVGVGVEIPLTNLMEYMSFLHRYGFGPFNVVNQNQSHVTIEFADGKQKTISRSWVQTHVPKDMLFAVVNHSCNCH